MIKYEKISELPNLFISLTGMKIEKFQELLPSFNEAFKERNSEKRRKRATGGGRKRERLSEPEDLLLFILIYCKLYPIQELQGFLFGMKQETACEWIHELTIILQKAIGKEICLPERKAKNLVEVLERCPGLNFAIDGTGRPTQRPKDEKKQREHYSGKSHRHEKKNILINDEQRRIVYLSPTYAGSVHDKKICDLEKLELPNGSILWRDTGFQGQDFKNEVKIMQPKKKPKGEELTDDEKRENQNISRVRVIVENQICSVKVFRLVKEQYRNHKEGFDDLSMETICGLHNFKIRKVA